MEHYGSQNELATKVLFFMRFLERSNKRDQKVECLMSWVEM